jgi:hypothetical protein
MASIMKRGDSYSVRYKYKDHSGKPCEGWESFKTKKEAQERKITVEKELLDGTFLVPDTMTVEEMLYKWIPIQSTKHKWSPKTYTQSVAMVQNLIVPYIGNRKVQELRTYDIEKFYATLAKTPCGQYVHGVKQDLSKKQKKRLLSSMFCWAASCFFCLARMKSCFSKYLRLPYSASSSNSRPCRFAISNSIFRQAASKVILRLLRRLRGLSGSGRLKPNTSNAFSCWGATSPYLFSQSNT